MLFRSVIECSWLSTCLEISDPSNWYSVLGTVRSCTGPNLVKMVNGPLIINFFFAMSRSIVMVQSKHHSTVQLFPDKRLTHIYINKATISLLLLYLLRQHRRQNHWHSTASYNCWLFSCCCWKQHLFGYSVSLMFDVLREHMPVSDCVAW